MIQRTGILFNRNDLIERVQWTAVTVTPSGISKSVTITNCHSNSVTLIVLNESGIAKTVTVFFEFISFLLFFLYLFRAAPAEPERGQNLFQAPNWDGDRPAMDILVQFST